MRSASRLSLADGTLPLRIKEAPTLETKIAELGKSDLIVLLTNFTGLWTSTAKIFNNLPSSPCTVIFEEPNSKPNRSKEVGLYWRPLSEDLQCLHL